MNARPHAFASFRACLAAGALSGAALAAHAQPPLQPGLWEEKIATTSDNAPSSPTAADMQAKLAAMPPDQRKMVEQMMASRGVSIGSDGITTVRVCLTKEQIARDFLPQGGSGNCTHRITGQSGKVSSFTLTCQGRHPINGQGTFTLDDPRSFTVVSDADAVLQPGAPASHLHSAVDAHFVSSDCGDVKPVVRPGP